MQRSNYVQNSALNFSVFTEQQKQEIQSATLEVLATVGVEVHSEKALELYKKGGAFVNGNRVKLPAALVERCIRSAPSRVVLADRFGESKIFLENHNFYYGPGPTVINMIDPYTGEHRLPKIKDTETASRVMDALPNIDFQMDFGSASDVTPEIMDVYAFKAMMENSVKPIVHWAYNVKNLKAMIDMGIAQRGSLQALQESPFFTIYTEPVTPLVHEFDALDISMCMAEHNLPSIYTPAPQSGVTAPATLAGTIVVSCCESLSGLVVNQLTREGAPFIMGGVITIMDMSTTQITYGSPEFMIMAAGLAEMSHYYKIPNFSTAGCSDAKCIEPQLTAEIAQNILMAALSGGNLIHDVGYVESGMCTSMESLAIADEIIGATKRIIRGIEVDENSLALDVIRAVGPGGNFMAEDHTAENFRKQQWFPSLINRSRYDTWEKAGKPTMADAAKKKVINIIEKHQPPKLDAKVQEKLDGILKSMTV